jgi:16S rRNA (uracil1498-N3)-methyltransferase
VNLALFSPEELDRPLPRSDRRAAHVLDVLRRGPGDRFDVGLIDGPRGQAFVRAIDEDGLHLEFSWGEPPPAADAITLLVGLPRPQTARDILREATALGVSAIHFVRTARSEPSYADSTLWRDGEWRRHVIAGAEQAFATRLPVVTHTQSLADALAPATAAGTSAVALDNYESTLPLAGLPALGHRFTQPLLLALGPERGWAEVDRQSLRSAGCQMVHLGSRVLRLETAVIAALTLAKAARGSL